MAHCPYEKLSDLEDILATIRALPAINEKKPGIFYLKSKSFLHFHTDGENRWADIRDGKTWGSEVDLPFAAAARAKAAFLREAKARHGRTLGLKHS